MKVLSPGKFEITINGVDRVVSVPLGLKMELYKLLTKAQVELARLSGRASIPPELADKVTKATEHVESLKAAEEDEVVIEKAQTELDELYTEVLRALEEANAEVLAENIVKRIDFSNKTMVDGIILLLSERDSEGKITKAVTEKELLWGEEYAEAQEELVSLIHGVTEYLTTALKKIQETKALMDSLVEKNQEE